MCEHQTNLRETFEDLKDKVIPVTGLDRPWGFQEVEAPKFRDNRHMKVMWLSALRNSHLYPPKKSSCHTFLLEVESTPGVILQPEGFFFR